MPDTEQSKPNDFPRLFWKKANIVYERLLLIVLIILLLIVMYCIYDTWYVYDHATDKSLYRYKPSAETPDAVDESPITDDYVAWLTIDDTNIDYPVMQGTDNTKYLNLDPYGQYSLSGSIYLDSRNSKDFSDDYSLVYGHHMEYGKMFGALDDFLDESYLKAHTDGKLIVGRKTEAYWPLKVFASMRASAKDNLVFAPTENEGVKIYIEQNAEVYVEFPEYSDKRILALSTCSEDDSAERILVFCYICD